MVSIQLSKTVSGVMFSLRVCLGCQMLDCVFNVCHFTYSLFNGSLSETRFHYSRCVCVCLASTDWSDIPTCRFFRHTKSTSVIKVKLQMKPCSEFMQRGACERVLFLFFSCPHQCSPLSGGYVILSYINKTSPQHGTAHSRSSLNQRWDIVTLW